MRRHLLAVLGLAVVGGLGLFTGGCSSGCGHCEDPCYSEVACHDDCGEAACNSCGGGLQTWYVCPGHGYTSARPGSCVHCAGPLEVRHAGCAVSPEGVAGPRSGGYGWQVEIAQAEKNAQMQAAARSTAKAHGCPECAKKAAAPKHHDCAECAKKNAQPVRRTVVREQPAPKPIHANKTGAKVAVDG